MTKEQVFLEIDEIYSEWYGGDLHIGQERENRIKKAIERAINYTRCCKSDSELFFCCKEAIDQRCNEQCLGCYTYKRD